MQQNLCVAPDKSQAAMILSTLSSIDRCPSIYLPFSLGVSFAIAFGVAALLSLIVIGLYSFCRWPLWERLAMARKRREELQWRDLHLQEEESAEKLLHKSGVTSTGDTILLLKQLGQGSAATVYLGEWCLSLVAVKCIRNAFVEEREAFIQETALMLKLRHPNIVQLLAASFTPDYQLILEYCEVGCLYDVLELVRTEGPSAVPWFNEERQHEMAMDVCRGLSYLHTRDPPIIHRDLKSHNVLITSYFVCKIADFGVSQNVNPATDEDDPSPQMVGTLFYLAPEIFDRKLYSISSDIYALGLTLWEILSVEELFVGMSPFEARRLNARPDLSQVSASFADVLSSCWATEPEQRPSAAFVYRVFAQIGS